MATISKTLAVEEPKTYSLSIDLYNVFLTTDATILEGETYTATNGTDTVTATMTNGVAKFILSAGTWDVAGIPLTVVAGQEYTLPIVAFAFHYSENDSSPTSVTYPSGYDNSDWVNPFIMNLTTGVPSYGAWDPAGENADKLAWFYPKSCMLYYNGKVAYYLNENDETKKADGTASDVASTAFGGNAMVEWGQDGRKIWWKIVPDSDSKGFTFCVANGKVDDDYHAWNHYDANGNLTDHFYTPKYFGSNVSSKLRSISGQSNFVSNTRNTEVTYARANNTTSAIEWDTEVYCDWLLVAMLCCLMAKSMNTQVAFGYGRCASGNSSAIGQGTMNGKGMFYGKSNQTEGVKVFGMENPWGNIWRGIRGLLYVSGTKKVKLTHSTIDGSTVGDYNFDGSGYISAGAISGTSGGYISHAHINEKYILPATVSGSETTYYADGCWFASGTMYAVVGGRWSLAGLDGAFCVHLNTAASNTGANVGASISCKPLAS